MRIIKKVLLLGMITLLTVGCGNKALDSAERTMVVEQTKEDSALQGQVENNVADANIEGKETQDQEVKLTLDSSLNRKVIKRGSLEMETKTFEETMNQLLKEVGKLGGFVENSNVYGNSLYNEGTSTKRGDIVVRIPQKSFDTFMNGSGKFGNIVSKSIEGQDITDAYVDTKGRLKSLTVQRDRLMTLVEQSGNLESLLAIEKELANVSYEIEKFQGTLNQYDSLVNFASITINVQEVATYKNTTTPVTLGEKIERTFKDSLKGVKQLGEICIVLIIALIPYMVIIVPAGFVIRMLVKRFKGKKKD